MEEKGILVLSDELAEARSLASELAKEGYRTWALSSAEAEAGRPRAPLGLLIVAFSARKEAALPLGELTRQWTGVPILVSSAVGLSQLQGPLHVLPIVSAVLFKPFGRETLLAAVADALGEQAREIAVSLEWNKMT